MTKKKTQPAKKRAPGRPTLRNEAVVARIIAGLEVGTPLTVICREPGMPSHYTVKDWQKADLQLAAAFVEARSLGEEVLAWECMAIADAPVTAKATPVDLRKVQIHTRLQLLAKFNPKRWGDKQQIEHSGSIGLAGRLAVARQRRTTTP